MKSTEKATQKTVLDYLTKKGVLFYRQNSGAFKTASGGFYKFASMNGLPDIVAIKKPHGQFIGIEVKDKKGVLNENQLKFKELLESAGGIFIIARSLDDVTPIL